MSRSPVAIHHVVVPASSRWRYRQRLAVALDDHPPELVEALGRYLEADISDSYAGSLTSRIERLVAATRPRGTLAGQLGEKSCGRLIGHLVQDLAWSPDQVHDAVSTIGLLHDLAGLPNPADAAASSRWLKPRKKTDERRSPRPLRLVGSLISVDDIVTCPRRTRQDLVQATLVAVAHCTGWPKEALVRLAPASFHETPDGPSTELVIEHRERTRRFSAAVSPLAWPLVLELADDVGVARPITEKGKKDERPLFRGRFHSPTGEDSWRATALGESNVEKFFKESVRRTAAWMAKTGRLSKEQFANVPRFSEDITARSPRKGLIHDLYDGGVELLQIAAYLNCDMSEVCNCLGVERPKRGR